MLRRVRGTLVTVETGQRPMAEVELPGGGICMEVLIPQYLADRLAAVRPGGKVELHTKVVLESTTQGASFTPRVIGFESDHDRRFFELLTGVKGLGTRKALRAMSVEPAVIASAVARDDTKTLEQLPEIGKRLAQTIVAELSGKVEPFLGTGEAAALDAALRETKGLGGVAGEAVEALVALGEGRADAERKVERVLAGRPAEAFERADELVAAAFGR